MKVKVTAVSSFMHGRIHMKAGEVGEFTKGDADELIKANLVREGAEEGEGEAPAPSDAQQAAAARGEEDATLIPAQPGEEPIVQTGEDDVSDLLGDEKMEAPAENKMEEAPKNKARGAKKGD